ncbi:serine/threonine-protein kinase [Streptomyces sp. TRM76323]|uniref:Serine/threonine-protein kinase n=1 Tax=Streptomyces tamarix TaxID=3078565 RepID=A0ABU3QPP4_9ACTN|nr:serine/threonine-protein kinase [Streptomyces tamarix]MDT9684726.1 serine/threonine-protein kinase [Streptomyces tamarix]
MTGAGTRLLPLGGDDPGALGPYRLLGRLGSGGMGRIYLARTEPDGPLVAVKTLLAEGEVSAHDRRRFTRKVTLARRVDNRYTARVLDTDPEAPTPWMAIEYIAAPSLAELVRTAGRLPASAIRWIAAGTAQALLALHGQGIVHRDVKPQNVLLPLDGPRLIDFGISHAQDITRTTLTLGTIAFTSPEQARGEPSTERSDVYSLGATLFHLAVGRPPYPEGEDTLRLLARVSRGDLDLAGLPKELVPLVRPCLAVEPADRPRPADVLDRFLEEMRGLPATADGSRWLPPRWTELIRAYERQGEEWRRPAPVDPEALTVDDRTRAVPPPDPTRTYTEERERARAREQERERARAREQERERERERGRQRVASRARARASAGARATGPAPVPLPAPSPPPEKKSSGGCSTALLVVLALLFAAWYFDDAARTTSSSTPGSGGSLTRPTPGYAYTPRKPTPSLQDLAFRAVRAGNCLDVYDTGYGEWSKPAPVRVDCDSASAYVHVTRVGPAGPCDSGPGRDQWSNHADDGMRTVLCLSRQFRTGQCFTAEIDGDGDASANLMEIWNCASDRVPKGQTHILQITGYYRMPSDGRTRCPDENNRYWTWKVNEGRGYVCTRVA